MSWLQRERCSLALCGWGQVILYHSQEGREGMIKAGKDLSGKRPFLFLYGRCQHQPFCIWFLCCPAGASFHFISRMLLQTIVPKGTASKIQTDCSTELAEWVGRLPWDRTGEGNHTTQQSVRRGTEDTPVGLSSVEQLHSHHSDNWASREFVLSLFHYFRLEMLALEASPPSCLCSYDHVGGAWEQLPHCLCLGKSRRKHSPSFFVPGVEHLFVG